MSYSPEKGVYKKRPQLGLRLQNRVSVCLLVDLPLEADRGVMWRYDESGARACVNHDEESNQTVIQR